MIQMLYFSHGAQERVERELSEARLQRDTSQLAMAKQRDTLAALRAAAKQESNVRLANPEVGFLKVQGAQSLKPMIYSSWTSVLNSGPKLLSVVVHSLLWTGNVLQCPKMLSRGHSDRHRAGHQVRISDVPVCAHLRQTVKTSFEQCRQRRRCAGGDAREGSMKEKVHTKETRLKCMYECLHAPIKVVEKAVLVATPVKNAADKVPVYFNNLQKLTYPKCAPCVAPLHAHFSCRRR